MPSGIGSFTDLHRYLDANDYLIRADVPHNDSQTSIDLTTTVRALVIARLRTPGRAVCTHGACRFAAHEHTSTQGPDGSDLEAAVPMRCRHCGQPAHHDRCLDDYRHDNPAAADCFLIHRDD
ncbi:hypothetical protein U2F26_31870 [Micromonospora sp. 4G57]|uniref:Uncharacterized protein n=1 Tax=Micromonospora sicca TaxID=2202420 RepID=A0ABU5JMV5_9ACTN|nr:MULTISPECIES: hypothetical protein [unclassified Micromonospora]MDZ5447254.1 hypothetical protein [Micromonospora sp. 4G57]MDZ5493950.1 hypothetical protein [Micromonospora sp. 4G53]